MRCWPLLSFCVILAASACSGRGDVAVDTTASVSEDDAARQMTGREHCLAYGDTVQLSGVLRRETHPGRPNYESIESGDEAETGFYLHLRSAICTHAGNAEDASELATDAVSRVQLVLDASDYARLRPQLDQTASLRGTLFSAFTGHHHAPLLLAPVW